MRSVREVSWGAILAVSVFSINASAQSEPTSNSASTPHAAGKPVIDDAKAVEHPLAPILKYARDGQRYVEQSVRSYTCRLIKRERFDDKLTDYQFARLVVREETRQGDATASPYAAFVEFLAPEKVVGRKVLYVSDENDNKMLVRRGGKRFSYVVVKLDPHGPSARAESRVPITEASFSRIIGGLASVVERHIEADPDGTNTIVHHSRNARINGRVCSVIRVVHPRKMAGLGFYTGTVFIDQQLHVPIRIEAYGWPDEPDQDPPLLAEYTYSDLQLNVEPGSDQFEPDAVRSR